MPSSGSYGVGKHGAVAVMESLHYELTMKEATHIKTHVLCPGVVKTNIARVNDLPYPDKELSELNPEQQAEQAYRLAFREQLEGHGMETDYIAEQMWAGIDSGRFYIVADHPDPKFDVGTLMGVQTRFSRLEKGVPPSAAGLFGRGGWVTSFNDRMARILEGVAEPVPAKSRL